MRIKPAAGALASCLVLSLAATLGVTTAAGAASDDPRTDPSTKAAKQALTHAQDALSGNTKKPPRDATMALRELWVAKDSLEGEDARAARAILSRPTDSTPKNKYDVYYGDGVPVESRCSRSLCLHWTEAETENGDAATPGYAAQTLKTLQDVHDAYVAAGYKPPLPDEGPARGQGVDTRPDVYLSNVGGLGIYGYCSTDARDFTDGTAVYAYCVLDNDYAPEEFGTAQTSLDNMRVTAAHEYFHAVQFAYDFTEDGWIVEATATWAEDELFDDVNDNRSYLPSGQLGKPGTSLDRYGSNSYGNWIFFRYLTEKYQAQQADMPTLVRNIWRRLDTTGGKKNRYSMQAVEAELRSRNTSMKNQYGQFALQNNTPARTYDEGANYPRPAYAFRRVKLSTSKKSASRSVVLDHLTSGTGAVVPFARGYRLKVAVDMTPRRTGSRAAVAVFTKGGRIDRSWIRLNRRGNGTKRVPFASQRVARVEVTLVNASTRMVRCGTDVVRGRYSCGGFGRDEDQKQKVRVTAVR